MDNSSSGNGADSPFSQIPVEVTVSVGCARPRVRDLLALGPDAVLTLDKKVEDPVDLYVGERLIARGELIELDGPQQGNLAVRLTEVLDARETP